MFLEFFVIFLSFLLPVVELMKNDQKWLKICKKKIKKMIKKWKNVKTIKKPGKLQFPKKWKIAIFLKFFSFFLSFFHFFSFFFFFICFIIFSSSGAKNFPKNKKIQFSSSCFHFFIIFLSFLLPVVELMKNDKKRMKNVKQN